ncbi:MULTISPECIES: hypothetical protein [Halobacterium]|uniref:hypothetical protein n=1 Tax=Halobacterium TaxID=2239 RepID=UPI00073E5DDC|nr:MULTISPECIES: hypothetical protein [Halobacterium]MCG1004847.1 hypothetical protein [Halobacterium noricense]UHH26911.1 hypothetical protein LT974_16635 [Halobacterium noricense]
MADNHSSSDQQTASNQSISDVARRLESPLTDTVGESLVGIAAYENGEYSVPYRDSDASAQYTTADITAILENVQLEGIGIPAYEDHHGQSLRATARVYEDVVTVVVPVTDTTGLVVALRNDAEHDPYEVIQTVEAAVSER